MRNAVRNYALVTGAYWGFTLTDGALRMLVLLHFDRLGYSAVEIAFLFLFYEFFGIVTNLLGGWIAARSGLKVTLYGGLLLQIVALIMLAFLQPAWARLTSVAYVMAAQALSGIAKDLTKMSAKSAIKVVVPEGEDGALFKWVARLTGSKNALKGAGFFLGAALLTALGFVGSLVAMAAGSRDRAARHRGRASERNGKGQIESQIHDSIFQERGGELAFGRAAVFVLRARCLVRGRVAGLPGFDAWLVLHAGRGVRRRVVRRLRHDAGNRAGDSPSIRRASGRDRRYGAPLGLRT